LLMSSCLLAIVLSDSIAPDLEPKRASGTLNFRFEPIARVIQADDANYSSGMFFLDSVRAVNAQHRNVKDWISADQLCWDACSILQSDLDRLAPQSHVGIGQNQS